jgi:hypothetical protein
MVIFVFILILILKVTMKNFLYLKMIIFYSNLIFFSNLAFAKFYFDYFIFNQKDIYLMYVIIILSVLFLL